VASGKVLALRAVGALEPIEAAALFVVRRSEGLTETEQGVLDDWLAGDASHRGALADAEHVWRLFDEPGDNEILTAMCAHALAQGPQTGPGWRRVTVAAAIVGLVAGILLAGAASGGRFSARRW
jgi:ferric-dicitrate binding protein FerR (iron transport regulator)